MKREEWIREENLSDEHSADGNLTIEETFEELDNLLEMLEQSENSLEESFRYFERGMKLVRLCSAQMDKVEKQILMLSEENHG